MSVTREMIEALRIRIGASRPLSEPRPASAIEPPPKRVFPNEYERSAYAQRAAEHTTALVGIGNVGTRYATDVVLQFQAELAVAHAAVATVLPEGWATANGLLDLRSRVRDHHEYLLRPDLGRRLDESSLAALRANAVPGVDVQPIVADGLSAVACMGSGLELLEAFEKECRARGWSVGTPMAARYARVWLEDEIGQTVGARVACIILGERPGLGTGDGLSAYMVYEPRIGKTDGDRNMMSNIHPRGTPPPEAAERLALVAGAMMEQRTSGVDLDLSRIEDRIGDAAGGLRAPQVREQLVEVAR